MSDDARKDQAPLEPAAGDSGTTPTSAPTPAHAAADSPPSSAPGEPLKGEVSRTDAPGAGVSAAPVGKPGVPAPKPANPAAAQTAGTSEVSSSTGQPTAPAAADPTTPAAAATTPTAAAKPAVARPAAPKPEAAAGAAPAAAAAKPAAARPAAAAGAAKPAPKPAAEHPPKVAPPSGPTEPAPPADLALPPYVATLQAAIAGSVVHISYWVGDWTIVVPPALLLDVSRHLRDAPDAAFDLCSDVTATDWPTRAERFDVIYCLYSTRHRHRVRVKVKLGEKEPLASTAAIWPSSNWLEREVFDMFGVNFTGHPDRRRILMPEDWQGYPQRKDYPLEGPGELLMENPLDWLKLRQAKEEADIE
jgi:NADH-quinone oxidoreductase subunit C